MHSLSMLGETIVSVELVDGKLEVTKRLSSGAIYATATSGTCSNTVPDRITKEIYAVEDGNIVLERTVQGKVTPPQYIPESISFDDE